MLKQQLQIKLSQKLSPQQIKLMKLIQLSTLDLEQKIEAEMGENPALETGKEETIADNSEEDYEGNTSIEAILFSLRNFICLGESFPPTNTILAASSVGFLAISDGFLYLDHSL